MNYNIRVIKMNFGWEAVINNHLFDVAGYGNTPLNAIKDICNSIEIEANDLNYEICNG